jgi:toxin CptA
LHYVTESAAMHTMNDQRRAHISPMALRPSYRLAALLLAAHAAAIGLLVTLPLPSWVMLIAAMALLGSMIHSVHRHALLRGRRAITTLAFSDRETIRVSLRDGSSHAGRVLGSSTIGTTLTLLNIALDGRRLPVHAVLLGDSLSADDFRRLRVWLRWGPRPPAEEPAAP